jgi:hypothetical protein
MEKIDWIKDLVRAEKQMEDSGLVELHAAFDPQRVLAYDSLQFLLKIKAEIVDSISAFNELKNSPLGRIKIYGIAKTHADFMLFRNGYKMIFSIKGPGQIGIRLNFIGSSFMPSSGHINPSLQETQNVIDEHILESSWGAFGEVIWTFKGQPIKIDYMVRHFMSIFVKESSK